jgi:hypothetical protein
MTSLLRILVVLCSLITAAHFLRFGTFWATLSLTLAADAFFSTPTPA